MEKAKRIEAELTLQLPEAIIQHIQSFLHGNEAAQTTILSRTWYQAWLTRPNLDFDQNLFVKSSDDFWEFAIKTMERYDKLNLTIDSLRLWIRNKRSHVNELIIKALKMGATCLDFKYYNQESEFVLPHQVFGFENLTRLSVSGCIIGDDNNGTVTNCCKLKSLTLDRVYVQGNIIWDIISSCHLIENFSLSSIQGFIAFGKQHVFRNLKCLYLYGVGLPLSYFLSFSSKFPRLVDLALHNCDCTDVENFYSPSLECINFTCCNMLRIEFDFPRIRKFTYSGSVIPSLSFITTTMRKWESRITIERVNAPSAEWFLELSGLLKKLSSSEVTLQLDVWSEKCLGYTGEFRGLSSKSKVGCLLINGTYSGFPPFYYYLFDCCRPDYISHIWIPKGVKKENDKKYFVVKRKMQQVCLYSCIKYQNMSECEIKKVEVKYYDDSVSEWLSRSFDATSVTSLGSASDEQEIRFYLKWER